MTENNEGVTPTEKQTSSGGMDQNKIFAILGYIIPILFFLPLVTEGKNNAYARFHANQQLNLLLFGVIAKVVLMALGATIILLPVSVLLAPVLTIAGFVFVVLGVINAANNSMKELPIIGKYRLIK